MQPLSRVLDIWPSVTALAEALGVKANTPLMWLARGRVPVEHRAALEFLSDGTVTVEDFGGEVWWRRVADGGWPHPLGRPLADFAHSVC